MRNKQRGRPMQRGNDALPVASDEAGVPRVYPGSADLPDGGGLHE